MVGVLLLLGWLAWDKSAPGALIAGIAGIWGAIKANIFGKNKEEIKIENAKLQNVKNMSPQEKTRLLDSLISS